MIIMIMMTSNVDSPTGSPSSSLQSSRSCSPFLLRRREQQSRRAASLRTTRARAVFSTAMHWSLSLIMMRECIFCNGMVLQNPTVWYGKSMEVLCVLRKGVIVCCFLCDYHVILRYCMLLSAIVCYCLVLCNVCIRLIEQPHLI